MAKKIRTTQAEINATKAINASLEDIKKSEPITFNSVLEFISKKHGMKTLSDQVNLSLACASIGLENLIDHVSISMDYLSIDQQVVFSEGIMSRYRDGIRSINFEI